MIVLVCGSRTFKDRELMWSKLDWYQRHEQWYFTLLIHGDAKGADRMAQAWAHNRGIAERAYPAEWDLYGKRAGYIRNQQMLKQGHPNMVLAFVSAAEGQATVTALAESKGTANMVALARDAGVEGFVIASRMQ